MSYLRQSLRKVDEYPMTTINTIRDVGFTVSVKISSWTKHSPASSVILATLNKASVEQIYMTSIIQIFDANHCFKASNHGLAA